MLRMLLITALVLAGATSALADADKDCMEGGSEDVTIRGCTEVIQRNPSYAEAYVNRGAAYVVNDDLDRALADFSKAIEINPKYALAHYNRGFVWKQKGELDRAIADYSKTIELDPKLTRTYNNRGFTHFDKGDFKAAAADFRRYLDLDGDRADTSAILFRYLARARAGEVGAEAELLTDAARLKDKSWPFAAAELLSGKPAPHYMPPNIEQLCAAHFYKGEHALLKGDRAEASRSLRLATSEMCRKRNPPIHSAAIAELKRLKP